ncbi:Leu/Phe/Val dehydrogenase [Endozoicomonas ascidiicola]|uniref:Leu/Phe/Val dehydrogenase n=1 Tax=Endozoicomonas ascidiicola TaxID=1698521 RepID=UPI00082D78C2|nr:amino acid dehydrogenase [Endozoicomonas ascidiicola]
MFRQITEAHLDDLHCRYDEASGLQSVIAIHSTRRGPALGGCRIIPYASSEEAITDAIRLARGMSYKAALAGLDLGGGKAVIMEPEGDYDRKALFQAFGRFLNELGGRYATAMDSGTTVMDMDTIATQSAHVTCTSSCGSPAPYTAEGVYYGILASLKAHPDLPESLKGVRVAVQGLGNVGYALCRRLHNDGALLTVTDIDHQRVEQCRKEFGARVVAPEDIYSAPCDVFSPCGLGGILNSETIDQLNCAAIAGSANNQLLTEQDGYSLFNRNILYAPDYLINSGGLIFVAMNYLRHSDSEMQRKLKNISDTLLQIFSRQNQTGLPASVIADQMAEAMVYGHEQTKLSA